jgi:hypothetical protein
VVRRSGGQKEWRREAPHQVLRRVLRLRVIGRLLRALENLGRAAAGAVDAADSVVHIERVKGVLSPAAPAPPKGAAKAEK